VLHDDSHDLTIDKVGYFHELEGGGHARTSWKNCAVAIRSVEVHGPSSKEWIKSNVKYQICYKLLDIFLECVVQLNEVINNNNLHRKFKFSSCNNIQNGGWNARTSWPFSSLVLEIFVMSYLCLHIT